MKYKEVKEHYKSGKLERHYSVDENGNKRGESRGYHANGQLWWRTIRLNYSDYGEAKIFVEDGTLYHHYLMDGNGKEIATVIQYGEESTHSEEELIEMAKEHGVPLLSELPKTEAEVTLWNLKYPDYPCLPICENPAIE